MIPDIWAACGGRAGFASLEGAVLRIVESQVQIATHRLVSSLEEQALLEEMLEAVKPPMADGTADLHYLLATPFRYPPLRHGSRFGRRHERGLYYGSLVSTTLLAEAAYYRLVYWHGMAEPPAAPLTTQHTVFSARYTCRRGVRLQDLPFSEYRRELTDPASYGATQQLGSAMREAGIEAFEFLSARDPAGGLNVALFNPAALASRRPESSQQWLAATAGDRVGFYCHEEAPVRNYPISAFTVAGTLPM